MIAIVAALEQEVRGIRRGMNLNLNSNEGRILLLKSGMGKDKVTQALNSLFQSYQPYALISTGFAGALREELQLGEIVLGERIFHLPEDRRFNLDLEEGLPIDPEMLEQAIDLVEKLGLPYQLGAILTAPKIITEAKEKQELGQLLPAMAVDMESYWVAKEACAYGIPFLAARVILDTVNETLPLFALVNEEGKLRGIKASIYFATRPRQLLKLIKLARKSKEAEGSLANFVPALAAKLNSFLNRRRVCERG